MRSLAAFLVCFALLVPGAHAASSVTTQITRARLISGQENILAGKTFWLALELSPQEGWHTYYKNPGDSGIPTSIRWQLPQGFTAGDIHWPTPERIAYNGIVDYGYNGRVLLPVPITVPAKLKNKSYTLTAHANWLVCKNICIPESATLTLELPVTQGNPTPSADSGIIQSTLAEGNSAGKSAGEGIFWHALLLALLGGLLLNIMPCVLPVLSLKALALARKAEHAPQETRLMGLAYTAGVLMCFAALAALLIALQQGGQAIGWGYQLQSPVFVALMVYLMFTIGLNLSGLFELPVLLGHTGSHLAARHDAVGSFFTGALAALVATPCTAPFMAPAIGYALTQPPLAAFCIFMALGFGMALPFLLISFSPVLMRFLPKPGAWMQRLREWLALPMYATAGWLLWVLAQQAGANAMLAVLLGCVLTALALWGGKHRKGAVKWLLVLLCLSPLLLVKTMTAPPNPMEEEKRFSIERVEALRKSGQPVFVDVTAAWCLTCKINEHGALNVSSVKAAFAAHNVAFLVADWTREDAEITHYLASFGRRGVPLYVYYPPKGEPVLLPQLLTTSTLLELLNR